MPIGETLAVLATLATALQTLRTGRSTSEPPAAAEVAAPDPVPLLALDAALSSVARQADAFRAQLHRLDALCLSSGVVLIVVALLRFQGVGSMALLIANIPIFIVVVACSIAVKYLAPMASVGASSFQDESISQMVDVAGRVEARNRRRLAVLGGVTDVLKAVTAVQVLLLAVWAIFDVSA